MYYLFFFYIHYNLQYNYYFIVNLEVLNIFDKIHELLVIWRLWKYLPIYRK